MTTIAFHLNFSGNCREAFEFYQSIFGGDLYLLTYGESPSSTDAPPNWQDKIIHAGLKTCDIELAGADLPPGEPVTYNGFQLLIQTTSYEEAKVLYQRLSKGGKETLPLHKTFWSPCYGIVNDKYGVPWEVNCSLGTNS